MERMTSHILWKIENVPNHQPAISHSKMAMFDNQVTGDAPPVLAGNFRDDVPPAFFRRGGGGRRERYGDLLGKWFMKSISGWWYSYRSEKYEFVSWDYYSKLNGQIKHVPNHPDLFCQIIKSIFIYIYISTEQNYWLWVTGKR